MTSHHSRGLKQHSYAWRVSEAFGYPCQDPLRLLAAAVIARWVDDGRQDEIGQEWAEAAEVPMQWLEVIA